MVLFYRSLPTSIYKSPVNNMSCSLCPTGPKSLCLSNSHIHHQSPVCIAHTAALTLCFSVPVHFALSISFPFPPLQQPAEIWHI
ncbi:hypothetical protein XELAEV_18031263mg [Xenopus laevis]|uniref:Uncharacterized protein n=1 Tax=Xenopus laevis TaxID=8355 RepID=A0A974CMB1_XENLA|nr:hypothetical protein XELAEV_18031263mg [Xenopus laevis]